MAEETLDPAATAWVLAATSLVVLMVFGVALFYGGLVRRKNVVNMIALSLVAMSVVSVEWAVMGFSLAFAPSVLGGLVGGLDYALLRGVGLEPFPGTGVPSALYVAFQLAFAAVTLAILTSPFAERASLTGFTVFALLWAIIVYQPVAHWVWGGGWLDSMVSSLTGASPLDFAGGLVVHAASGFSALAIALVIGPRRGLDGRGFPPHSIPMTLLGAGLLWFGWFGFNAGSALAADGVAGSALLSTHLAAASGALAWGLVSWLRGRPSSVGMASGALAGLVAITPAAGYVEPWASIPIGVLAAVASYYALAWRLRSGIDESLDAWAVHGVAGVAGSLITGVFASEALAGQPGLLWGGVPTILAQLISTVVVVVYAFAASYLLAKAVEAVVGLRVREEEEYVGLDVSQHGEEAYAWTE